MLKQVRLDEVLCPFIPLFPSLNPPRTLLGLKVLTLINWFTYVGLTSSAAHTLTGDASINITYLIIVLVAGVIKKQCT